jgi:hypothetical protein
VGHAKKVAGRPATGHVEGMPRTTKLKHRLSNEERRRAREDAQARVDAGELEALAFEDTITFPDGRGTPFHELVTHPALRSLDVAVRRFLALRPTNNPVSLAVAPALVAIARAVRQRDMKSLAAFHSLAAKQIKPPHPAALDPAYVPVLDARGVLRAGIAAAYDSLVTRVEILLTERRQDGESIGASDVELVTEMLAHNFPSIATLAKMPEGNFERTDDEYRQYLIGIRVRPQLAVLERQTRDLSARDAAELVVEQILRRELEDSDLRDHIDGLFDFKRQRQSRIKYPAPRSRPL